jgi:phospholipid/cholesterol/gamma-HCH transport system substrate-binding protein
MKRSQLKDISMEVVVGAFMFMILLGLGYFTIILSYENIFKDYHQLEVRFDHVRGLRQGDNVFTRGVMIGRVKALDVRRDGVRVVATLETPVELREGYSVQILPSSVLGGQYLAIHEGPLDAPPLKEDTPIVGRTPVDLMDEATEAITSLRHSLEDGGILENLEETMAHLESVTGDLADGRGTIGRLMKDEKVYENIVALTDDMRTLTASLEKGEGTLGQLMKDDSVYASLKEITDNLTEVSQNLVEGKGTLGRLLSEDDQLYQDLSEAVAAINQIAQTLSKNEGTIGRLINDDDIYEDAKLLIHEIRATIDDFRETAPITTFTSIFFGAF